MEYPSAARPLLVLDETLWHGIPEPAMPEGHRFLLRPHVKSLLEGVAEHNNLAVWTAASEDWVKAGLQTIASETAFDLASQAFFLWHRERCTWRRNEAGEYELRKSARKFKIRWIRALYPSERVPAVNGQSSNYECGYGHLVRVGRWTGDQEDHELQALAEYLVSTADDRDLRQLEKRHGRSTVLRRALPDPTDATSDESWPDPPAFRWILGLLHHLSTIGDSQRQLSEIGTAHKGRPFRIFAAQVNL